MAERRDGNRGCSNDGETVDTLLSAGDRSPPARAPRLAGLALAVIALAACGGSGGGDDDETAPTVVATSPADGATRVLTTARIEATFSEAMNAASLDATTFALSFNPPVPGTVAYDAATRTAVFTPDADLPAGKQFTATIATGAEDEAGNGLAAAYQWSFTAEPWIERVSLATAGAEGDQDSSDCEHCVPISANGRFVAFESLANTLVGDDTNGVVDAYLRDVDSGTTVRVSLPNAADTGTLGQEADNSAQEPSLSADGRYVAFYSGATNLVPDDTNGQTDVFVHDTTDGSTRRVSLPNLADQGTLGAEANDTSQRASLGADGGLVAFHSRATNLVSGDTNAARDVFVHDLQTGATERVSVATGGAQADGQSVNAAISADGRYVAFESAATNLDVVTADTNGITDIYVHDRISGETVRASVNANGDEASGPFGSGNPSLSADGRYVAFWSSAANLVADDFNGHSDVFVKDLQTGAVLRANLPNLADQGTLGTEADNGSLYASISGDGRYVAFASDATNLVVGDSNATWDVFVHDTDTGVTRLLSTHADGTQVDTGTSDWASISADGRYVTFYSGSALLVDDDSNARDDVFRVLNAPLPPP